ncbi:hypothetical protein [Streptomyces sp. NBC_01022]|uniref:hypothetical protein n=1 Tax=Streptomyces sp. NBC_01022 TaxID=2903723 RepID=UPI002DDB3FD5|nr:hypothetical protein [Streptomyces sp. NBC_01022]WRZ80390.1 hypothetical protein OG316_08980 [Streptomyces sp. NBC_01022]
MATTTRLVIGLCWRCSADDVPDAWLGPVQSQEHGQHAPIHACEPCMRRMEAPGCQAVLAAPSCFGFLLFVCLCIGAVAWHDLAI